MSIYEVLKVTIDLLGNIRVPVMYGDIAKDIAAAAGNLTACVQRLEADAKQREAEKTVEADAKQREAEKKETEGAEDAGEAET